jgi:CO/xanthine dehydrogenase FAD-binding subunit
MPANIREFHRASSPSQALELLQRTDTFTSALIVGPRLPDAPYAQTDAVVDLQALTQNAITITPAAIQIGAHATLQTLVASAPLAAVADGILCRAAALSAHFGLRNLATVAGAIDGATATPPGPPEVLLALLVLGARVKVIGGADGALAAYRPSRHTVLDEITIADAGQWRGALARVARSPLDQAIVTAAAAVSPTLARVAVAGAAAGPITAEVKLDGDRQQAAELLVSAVLAHVEPQGDYRGSAEYRRAMAEVLARRALNQAFA